MTAVLTDNVDDPRNTDADLVRGSMAGDRTAFAQIYDRYADRLHDFCARMLRDHDGAADCVQEAFCVAATRLPQLREPDKLRPWLYAIARNEALARLRERRRETPFDDLPDVESPDETPDIVTSRTELADLIAEAAGGLSDRDRVVFDLAFHHGLSGTELADALEISHTNANKIVFRLRRTIERCLGALMLSRHAESAPGRCAELSEILSGWDGQLTVLMRKRISRHIESCSPCDDEQRRLVNPAAMLGTTPVFIVAPDWLRERTLAEVQLTSHGSPMEGESDDAAHSFAAADAVSADDAGARRRNRRWLWAAVLLMAALGASAGLTFAWSNQRPMTITSADVSGPAPEPDGQTPTPTKLLPTPIIPDTPTTVPNPTVQPPPQVPVIPVPTPTVQPPQVPVIHVPTEKPPPQAQVVQTPIRDTPNLNAQPPAGPPRVGKQTPVSEPEHDVRRSPRFPTASPDRGPAPKTTPSLQRSSPADVEPPSAPRPTLRTAQDSDSDAEPNSPTPRRPGRDAGGSDADSPDRRGTGR
jgi:RNA polymerase sigma factor (sigma-70 family)